MTQYSSQPLTLERQLSIEETYNLANTARRKSSSQATRNDLRLKLGHAHMLEALEQVIRTSPPPSPKQHSSTPLRNSRTVSYAPLAPQPQRQPTRPAVDEYGFAYDDEYDDEEDDSLSLTRTVSRR